MKTLKQFLTEVGDSRRAYPYTIKFGPIFTKRNAVIETSFKSGTFKYTVTMWTKEYLNADSLIYELKFEANDTENITNAGVDEAFRVMATVIAFVKEVISKHPQVYDGIKVGQITFTSSAFGKDGRLSKYDIEGKKKSDQRMKLYLKFANNELRNLKYKMVHVGNFVKITT